jgi:hypothetical protein
MTGHNRLENYIDNLEALLRKNRSRTALSSITPPAVEPVTPVPSATTAMAQKSLRKFSIPVVANFELRTRLITMVQANSFCGLPSEDADGHL